MAVLGGRHSKEEELQAWGERAVVGVVAGMVVGVGERRAITGRACRVCLLRSRTNQGGTGAAASGSALHSKLVNRLPTMNAVKEWEE